MSGPGFVRRCCWFYLGALVLFWLLALSGIYAKSVVRHVEFGPKSLLFSGGDDTFMDFLNFDPKTERMNPKVGFPPLVYPAPAMAGYILFNRLFPAPLWSYLGMIAGAALLGAATLWLAFAQAPANRGLLEGVVAVSLLLSYPLVFLMERANMEGLVWVATGLGIGAFVARRYTMAAIFVGLAASMKMYPGLLFLLFVSRRQYKELAVGVVAVLVSTVAALRLISPNLPAAFAATMDGVARNGKIYFASYRQAEIGYDHSVFSVIKQMVHMAAGPNTSLANRIIHDTTQPYFVAVGIAFGLIYWLRIRKLPLVNQVIALLIFAVTLPYWSGEYTLVHLYFGWGLFLLFLAYDVAAGGESIEWAQAARILVCFAFVFALGPMGKYAGQLKAIALMILLYTVLTVPVNSSLLEEQTTGG